MSTGSSHFKFSFSILHSPWQKWLRHFFMLLVRETRRKIDTFTWEFGMNVEQRKLYKEKVLFDNFFYVLCFSYS